ncbi:hypothetical protein EC973_000870 [Apophysomyces ossiformis]|uniref:Major facilitator superfamily (MFS) profile domain-containing protein n=1 Tax=Apophysomyces ossiformis TaxID=679940 RepID=A0A8H7BIN6_9FUNG|nr:hypothetical protein EC973_000870 [Apophysomyces ossiformis]
MLEFYTQVFCDKHYESKTVINVDGDLNPIQDCSIPEVQSVVATAVAIIMFLSFGPGIFTAGYFGKLSDRKGRKVIYKIAAVGQTLQLLCYVITAKYQDIVGVTFLFLAPIIRGVFVGETVLSAAVQAYIADCTTMEDRTVAFGRLIASVMLGACLGPFAGGYLLSKTNSILVLFYVGLSINILFIIYTTFVMPESVNLDQPLVSPVEDDNNKNSGLSSYWSKLNFFATFAILFRARSRKLSTAALPILAILQFLFSAISTPPILLYAMLKYHWTSFEGGVFVSVSAFNRLVITLALLPLLTKLFRKSSSDPKDVGHSLQFDLWLLRVGFAVLTVSLLWMGLSESQGSFVISIVVLSLSVLCLPTLSSLLTAAVDPSEVGEVMTASAVLDSFGVICAQSGANGIYSATVATFPNVVFFICAGVAVMALCLAFFVYPVSSNTDEEGATTNHTDIIQL